MPHHAVPSPQLAESSSARAALEARLADADSRLASSRSASDAAASRAASATAALDAEKFATRETTRKLQTAVTEKATLKAEIAVLEEQLMAYANAPTPGPLDHLAGFAGSVAAVVKEVAPGVLDEALAVVKSASVSVAGTVAPVVPAVTKASAAAADATKAAAARLRKQAGPAATRAARGARAAAAAAAPTLAEAATRAVAVRDALQRVIVERVSKMEAFSSVNVDEHRLEHVAWLFATGVVASPIVFVCVRVALTLAAAAFGKRRRAVPRRVAEDSVPLRTPTPEKKTAPFGARTRAQGRTIRSPEGEVLRFA